MCTWERSEKNTFTRGVSSDWPFCSTTTPSRSDSMRTSDPTG
jgi:hypothetical protein